jgi:hypothetical protein
MSTNSAAYAIFARIMPTKDRPIYPVNLLDEEEVMATRKTISVDALTGRERKPKKEGTRGGAPDRITVYEFDFGAR